MFSSELIVKPLFVSFVSLLLLLLLLVCVRFLSVFAFALGEDELDAVPFRVEEFVILSRSVEDEKNLMTMMVERGRIGFVVQMLRTDVERAKLMFVAFRIAGAL